MLPTGLVCLICFSFSGVAGDGWFCLEIVGCKWQPAVSPRQSFKVAFAGVVALAERAAGGSDPGHTECQPRHFCESWEVFSRLLPRPFHQTLPPSMLNVLCWGPSPPPCILLPHSLSWHVDTLSLACLHSFYSHPPASQDLPGPQYAQEGLLQLFGGPPCASTTPPRVAQQPFLYNPSLQYVDLLKALGGLEPALCSLLKAQCS